VAHISVAESPVYFLDRAIDHSLGTDPSIPARRAAVYGATQEFTPGGNQTCNPSMIRPAIPEEPRTTRVDGWEGQNMNVAVIDSGVDYRHPMFGGIGPGHAAARGSQASRRARRTTGKSSTTTRSPRPATSRTISGTARTSHRAPRATPSTATRHRGGLWPGRDGTASGPTINNAQLFGTAPQSRIMAYKVCGPASSCPGDIPLAIEDAASPFTLVASGNPGPTPVAKPVADVTRPRSSHIAPSEFDDRSETCGC
jgi:subtilisin family serine protease